MQRGRDEHQRLDPLRVAQGKLGGGLGPADTAMTAARGTSRASSSAASVSAWAAWEASAGMGLRRYPNLEGAMRW